jgi:predicted SnoaL-like aldol condensation-catalyzing enzyme
MEYKYSEGIEIIIKNTDSIKNNNMFYQPCSDNCVPRGDFYPKQTAILKHHDTDNPRFVYYLDFGNGYVSDWFSEREIEHIAGGKENLVHPLADILEEKTKLPLGVVNKFTIQVYLDDGRIFEYEVDSPDKAREHASAIINTGYRHNDGVIFEHYPPHRINKIKCPQIIPTKYPDRVSGT